MGTEARAVTARTAAPFRIVIDPGRLSRGLRRRAPAGVTAPRDYNRAGPRVGRGRMEHPGRLRCRASRKGADDHVPTRVLLADHRGDRPGAPGRPIGVD